MRRATKGPGIPDIACGFPISFALAVAESAADDDEQDSDGRVRALVESRCAILR
jgi:hypothetical protein